MSWILGRLLVLYLVVNMTICALIFMPWAKPRETISGLLGRWSMTEGGLKWWFGWAASAVVDWIYFWEPDHCASVYVVENAARAVLYPEG